MTMVTLPFFMEIKPVHRVVDRKADPHWNKKKSFNGKFKVIFEKELKQLERKRNNDYFIR